MTKATPAISRFWRKVEKTPNCWNWTGSLSASGYGSIVDETGKRRAAHRFAFERLTGPIPSGMLVDHICHNKSCVKPAHLRLATNKQNLENLTGPYVNNQSGFRGVSYHPKRDRYQARVRHNGRCHSGGYYRTPEEAAEAATVLRLRLFTHNELDKATA